jgi:hypothetical protein
MKPTIAKIFMSHLKISLAGLTAVFVVICTSPAFAWGERGHDIVTRVAVQNLSVVGNGDLSLTTPFTKRDHMLSHLSNTPDIVWRAKYMSKQDRGLNYPTHFINLERVYQSVNSLNDVDLDYADYAKAARDKGIEDPASVGTAPWRVLQLHGLMTKSLLKAGASESVNERVEAINQALLYAGLMSHFVGDLANPHHATANYNGQLTGNTGLHAYFESDVVGVLPLGLSAQTKAMLQPSLLKVTVLKEMNKQQRVTIMSDPRLLIFSLVVNSQNNLGRLIELDNEYSLVEASSDARKSAIRELPQDVAPLFHGFITERLAIGAAVLSQLWLTAWEQAGKPDLSDYQSYDYEVKPEFIAPDYLVE